MKIPFKVNLPRASGRWSADQPWGPEYWSQNIEQCKWHRFDYRTETSACWTLVPRILQSFEIVIE